VNHKATPRFWQAYNALPLSVGQLADRSFAELKRNPRHPGLAFKKVGDLWSARVGLHHRALAVEQNNDMVWYWIGTHADYDKFIN